MGTSSTKKYSREILLIETGILVGLNFTILKKITIIYMHLKKLFLIFIKV